MMDEEAEDADDGARGSLEMDFRAKEIKRDASEEVVASDREVQPVSMEEIKRDVTEEPQLFQAPGSTGTAGGRGGTMEEIPADTRPLEDGVVSGVSSSYSLETPETRPQEENGGAEPEEVEDVSSEEYLEVLQQLQEQRKGAEQHSIRQQRRLAEYFCRKAGGDGGLEDERPGSRRRRRRRYEELVGALAELKQHNEAESETVRLQAEELRERSRGRLQQVEDDWRAFVAVKQEVAASMLSRCPGGDASWDRVQSALRAEQLRQDEVVRHRLRNIKLHLRIERLEEELGDDEDEKDRDPLLVHFERLQTERLKQKQLVEKQNEEMSKLQKKILGSVKVLSWTKSKLQRSQKELQAKLQLLDGLHAELSERRGQLSRTKQLWNSLQRTNGRLKERTGLLGNRVLLQDFEDTVDSSEWLDKRLDSLVCRQAEVWADYQRERMEPVEG